MNYKIVDADKLESDLATLADSIRAKRGTSEALAFPYGMKAAVDGIPVPDFTNEDGLLNGTLTEYTNDRVTEVRQYAFFRMNVVSVNLPSVKTLGSSAFSYCQKLTAADFPYIENVPDQGFQRCSALSFVNVPNATKIGQSGFGDCANLSFIDLPKVTELSYQAFSNCTSLKTLVLRSPTLCTAVASNTIQNITGCSVYVPQALISEYQNATNWSSAFSKGNITFVAIEGSEYE